MVEYISPCFLLAGAVLLVSRQLIMLAASQVKLASLFACQHFSHRAMH
jgi:hypothetical protein